MRWSSIKGACTLSPPPTKCRPGKIAFAISSSTRFLRATPLNSYFRKPADFDLEKHLGQGIGIFSGGKARDFKIRISERGARWVMEDPWARRAARGATTRRRDHPHGICASRPGDHPARSGTGERSRSFGPRFLPTSNRRDREPACRAVWQGVVGWAPPTTGDWRTLTWKNSQQNLGSQAFLNSVNSRSDAGGVLPFNGNSRPVTGRRSLVAATSGGLLYFPWRQG